MAKERRLLIVLGLFAVAAIAVPAAAWGSLPERLAVHWDIRGRPDGFLPPAGAWLATGGVTLVLGLLTWLLFRATGRHRALTAAAALGLFLSGVLACATVVVTLANAGASRPPEVSPLVAIAMLATGGIAVVVVDLRLAAGGSRFRLAPGRDDAIWRGTAKSGFAFPTAAVFVVLGVLVGTAFHLLAGAGLLVAGLMVLSVVGIEVELTADRVRVRYFGGLRWPATEIRLSEVERVEAIEVEPSRYGGWGYRGSLRLMGRAALNLRRGPGLRLALTGGRTFVVTVDEADLGAIAIRDQLARTAEPTDHRPG